MSESGLRETGQGGKIEASKASGALSSLYRHRHLLRRTIPDVVRKRYAGQVAGLFWLVLSPMLLMTLYAAIYLVVFQVRPVNMTAAEYVLYIFSGLIPFLGFAEALTAGTTSLSKDRNVLLNTVFPPELLPFQAVVGSHATTLVGLGVVSLVSVGLGKATFWILLLPVALLLQVMFVAGIVWVLSLASLVVRDIQQALTFLVMALLVATPIAYTQDMVPGALGLLIYANPYSYFVLLYHDLVVTGAAPSWPVALGAVTLALASFGGGYWVFQRMKRSFFDYA